jgi:hypothetical protein
MRDSLFEPKSHKEIRKLFRMFAIPKKRVQRPRKDALSRSKVFEEARRLKNAIYAHHRCGCCWHLVLDDGNVRPQHIRFCKRRALVSNCGIPECLQLARLSKHISQKQWGRLGRQRQPNERPKIHGTEFVASWQDELIFWRGTPSPGCIDIVGR